MAIDYNNPYQDEIIGADRQRKLAEALVKQGLAQNNMQGQMVSGRFVGASPWQGVANLANIYVGKQLGEEADLENKRIAEKLRTLGTEEVLNIGDQIKGRAESNVSMAGPFDKSQGINQPVMNYPEIKPDMNKAMTMAASARTPEGRAFAPALMANFIPKDITPVEKEQLRLRQREIDIQEANANRGSYSPTMTDQGLVVINSKTGQPQLVTDASGKPYMGQASSALGKEFTELNQQKSIINGVLKGVESNRDAFGPVIGAKGMLPFGDVVQNRKFTPQQLEARSEVFNTASAVIKERAGTAQSASEKETIMRFLPSPLDSADVIVGKMNGYNRYIQNKEAGTTSVRGAVSPYYGKTSKELESTVAPAATPSQVQSTPIYATNGKERIVSTDGGINWKPVGSQ